MGGEATTSPIETSNMYELEVAPGRLGLNLQFVEGESGALIIEIDPSCSFKDKVNVGDRILRIDGRDVSKEADLLYRTEFRRVFSIVPVGSPSSLEAVCTKHVTNNATNKKENCGRYYAVKVGYALPTPIISDDEDENHNIHAPNNRANKKRKYNANTKPNQSTPLPVPLKIQSAIFLKWEDARVFIEEDDMDGSHKHKAEYAVFSTFQEAEDYLLGERETQRREGEQQQLGDMEAEQLSSASQFIDNMIDRYLDSLPPQLSLGVVGVVNTLGQNSTADSMVPQSIMNPLGISTLNTFGNTHLGSRSIITDVGALGQGAVDLDSLPTTMVEATAKSTGQQVASPTPAQTRQSKIDEKSYAHSKDTAQFKEKVRQEDCFDNMCRNLELYKEANDGSVEIPEIPQDEVNTPEMIDLDALRRWCSAQIIHCRRFSQGHESGNLNKERFEKLRDLGLHVGPSYEDMYHKLQAHKEDTGSLEVDQDTDNELYLWTKTQQFFVAQHFQGEPVPISDDKIQSLISLGFKECCSESTPEFSIIGGQSLTVPALPPSSKKPIRSREGQAKLAGDNSRASIGHGDDDQTKTTLTKEQLELEEESIWNTNLEALLEYKEKHGHFMFPKETCKLDKKERPLKYWVIEQRREFKKVQRGEESTLTARRLQRLNDIGLEMRPRPDYLTWDERMQMLRQFKEEHGHLKPNRGNPTASVIRTIRRCYREREEGKKNSLSDERVRDLEEIGFVFKAGKRKPNFQEVEDKTWDEYFQDLLAFKEKHGHTLVSRTSGSLGTWVQTQRQEYRMMKNGQSSFMTAEKTQKLVEIGFLFDADDEDDYYSKSKEPTQKESAVIATVKGSTLHAEGHGYTLRSKGRNGVDLYSCKHYRKPCFCPMKLHHYTSTGEVTFHANKGSDVAHNEACLNRSQRKRAGKRPNFQVKALQNKSWDERFQDLLAFKEKHGHTLVSRTSGPLGTWVQTQRYEYRMMKKGQKSFMTTEKALKLAEMGFLFDAKAHKGHRFSKRKEPTQEEMAVVPTIKGSTLHAEGHEFTLRSKGRNGVDLYSCKHYRKPCCCPMKLHHYTNTGLVTFHASKGSDVAHNEACINRNQRKLEKRNNREVVSSCTTTT